MFIVLVEWEIADAGVDTFKGLIGLQAKNSIEREVGCLKFDVGQSTTAPRQFLLYEIYKDAEAFEAHKQTDHYAEFTAKVDELTVKKTVRTYCKL